MLRRGSVIVVCALACAAAIPARAAAPADPGVRMDVTEGFDGRARAFGSNPLTIVIESDRLFAGAIVVEVPTPEGPPATFERAVEVPGGSRKVVRLVIPRATVNIVRAVDRGGRAVATAIPSTSTLERGEPLVGVLTNSTFDVRVVTVPGVPHLADVIPVAPELVDLGMPALDPLSHLVVDASIVPRLSPRQRDAIVGFAANGGELVVAAAGESALRFLPESWRGAGGGTIRRTPSGTGYVVVALSSFTSAGWRAGGSMWRETLHPGDAIRWTRDTPRVLRDTVGVTSRFRTAGLGWLLAFVIAYALLSGPVCFFVLSRKRKRELAWVVVPILAVMFAGGAFAAGRGLRSGELRHGLALVYVGDESERVAAGIATLSRHGGSASIEYPDDWTLDVRAPGEGSTRYQLAGSRVSSDVRMAVGDVMSAAVSHLRFERHGRAGTITAGPTGSTAEVVNVSGFDLVDSYIVAANGWTRAGALGNGERFRGDFVPQQRQFEEFYGYNGGEVSPVQVLTNVVGATWSQSMGPTLVGVTALEDVAPSIGLEPMNGWVVLVMPLRTVARPNATLDRSLIGARTAATDVTIMASGGFRQYDVFGGRAAKDLVLTFTLPSGAPPREVHLVDDTSNFGGPRLGGAQSSSSLRVSYFDRTMHRWSSPQLLRTKTMSLPPDAVGDDRELTLRITSDFDTTLLPAAFSLKATT